MLLFCVAANLAAAQPEPNDPKEVVTGSFTNDFEIRYWMSDERLPDPDDVAVFNYLEQVNRLNAFVSYKKLSVATQIDEVALFFNRYRLDDELTDERILRTDELSSPLPSSSFVNIEKLRVRYESDILTLSLGDSYAVFGRGIALNLNRNVDIDIDTSIQGLHSVVRAGAWDFTFVGGQLNRQQIFQDNPNLNLTADRRHLLTGARVERFGLGPANIGLHGVMAGFTEEPGIKGSEAAVSGAMDVMVGGATVELMSVAGVDWFAEADVFSFADQLESEEGDLGYAAYLSASFYPGAFVVTAEGKRYSQAERMNSLLTPELYEMATGPTLEYERAITEDSSAALNSYDVWAGRVRVDWAAKPGELAPFVALGVFRDNDVITGLHFNDVPETIIHPLVGVEYIRKHGSAIINAGVRVDDRDGQEAGADRQIHGDATLHFPIPGDFSGSLNTAIEQFKWGNNGAFQQTDYIETENSFTLSKGKVAATLFFDYSTNPLINGNGNLTDSTYGAGELQYKPSSRWTMKVFGGAYKAGIRCSGGQCRLLPGFEGARFSVVGSF